MSLALSIFSVGALFAHALHDEVILEFRQDLNVSGCEEGFTCRNANFKGGGTLPCGREGDAATIQPCAENAICDYKCHGGHWTDVVTLNGEPMKCDEWVKEHAQCGCEHSTLTVGGEPLAAACPKACTKAPTGFTCKNMKFTGGGELPCGRENDQQRTSVCLDGHVCDYKCHEGQWTDTDTLNGEPMECEGWVKEHAKCGCELSTFTVNHSPIAEQCKKACTAAQSDFTCDMMKFGNGGELPCGRDGDKKLRSLCPNGYVCDYQCHEGQWTDIDTVNGEPIQCNRWVKENAKCGCELSTLTIGEKPLAEECPKACSSAPTGFSCQPLRFKSGGELPCGRDGEQQRLSACSPGHVCDYKCHEGKWTDLDSLNGEPMQCKEWVKEHAECGCDLSTMTVGASPLAEKCPKACKSSPPGFVCNEMKFTGGGTLPCGRKDETQKMSGCKPGYRCDYKCDVKGGWTVQR